MKKSIILLLIIFTVTKSLHSQEKTKEKFKVTFEFLSDKENEQFVALFESNANGKNGAIAFAQQSKQIISGWRHTYYTTDKDNPLILKVGTLRNKKRKVTINLYINDKLVETKKGKAGNFLTKPLTLMTYYDKIKDRLK